MHTFFINDLI